MCLHIRLAYGGGDGREAGLGEGPRQAQGHRDKAHAGQMAPLREVVAIRPEDRAVEEGLGSLPGQDHAGGAGAERGQGLRAKRKCQSV